MSGSLIATNISHAYTSEEFVLRNCNLEWSVGDIVGIEGNNGAGKTTLMRLLATNLLPRNGQIVFDHENCIDNLQQYRQKVSWLQSSGSALFDRLTGQENLQLFFGIRERKKDLLSAFEWWSALPGFEKSLTTPFYLCSAGMKQILALFRCLETQAKIYILDEPSTHLDEQTLNFICREMKSRSANRLQVVTSHDKKFLHQVATRIVKVENGQLFEDL